VPLTGENRILVRAGMERLPQTQKIGLRALMEIADVPDKVTTYHVGFRIGPRLNAAGRLADAMAALELLLTNDAARAADLAKLLNEHNAKRQGIESQITEEAIAMARVTRATGCSCWPRRVGMWVSSASWLRACCRLSIDRPW